MKNIIIGGKPYGVVLRKIDSDTGDIGRCSPYRQLLIVDNTMPMDSTESILSHEILHAIIMESGADVVVESQEKLVRVMENVFYRFLKDNGFEFSEYIGDK